MADVAITYSQSWLPPVGFWRALPGVDPSEWAYTGSDFVYGPGAGGATVLIDSQGQLVLTDVPLRPGQLVPALF